MVALKDRNNKTSKTDNDNLMMNPATNPNNNVGIAKTVTAAATAAATAPVTTTMTSAIVQPTKYDVLFGRGRSYQEHYGNQRFLRIVERNRQRYQKALDRHIKAHIVNETIMLVEHEEERGEEEEQARQYEVAASSTSGSSNMDLGQDGDEKNTKDSVVPIRARFLKQHKITTTVDPPEGAGGGDGGDGPGGDDKTKKKKRRRRKKKSKKNSGDGKAEDDGDDEESVGITWYEAPYDDVFKKVSHCLREKSSSTSSSSQDEENAKQNLGKKLVGKQGKDDNHHDNSKETSDKLDDATSKKRKLDQENVPTITTTTSTTTTTTTEDGLRNSTNKKKRMTRPDDVHDKKKKNDAVVVKNHGGSTSPTAMSLGGKYAIDVRTQQDACPIWCTSSSTTAEAADPYTTVSASDSHVVPVSETSSVTSWTDAPTTFSFDDHLTQSRGSTSSDVPSESTGLGDDDDHGHEDDALLGGTFHPVEIDDVDDDDAVSILLIKEYYTNQELANHDVDGRQQEQRQLPEMRMPPVISTSGGNSEDTNAPSATKSDYIGIGTQQQQQGHHSHHLYHIGNPMAPYPHLVSPPWPTTTNAMPPLSIPMRVPCDYRTAYVQGQLLQQQRQPNVAYPPFGTPACYQIHSVPVAGMTPIPPPPTMTTVTMMNSTIGQFQKMMPSNQIKHHPRRISH